MGSFSAYIFVKKTRLGQWRFLVNVAKYLKRYILETICERLLLMYDYCFFCLFIKMENKDIKDKCFILIIRKTFKVL